MDNGHKTITSVFNMIIMIIELSFHNYCNKLKQHCYDNNIRSDIDVVMTILSVDFMHVDKCTLTY